MTEYNFKSEDHPDETMAHLGHVLAMLGDLHPDHHCRAYTKALDHYNKHNPRWKVLPGDYGFSKLLHIGPIDQPQDPSSQYHSDWLTWEVYRKQFE